MFLDNNTYGFNIVDAEDTVASLGNREVEIRDRQVRDVFSAQLGRTGSGGIPLGSEATVTLYDETTGGWTLGSNTIECWTFPTAIVGVADVLIIECGTRYLALKLC